MSAGRNGVRSVVEETRRKSIIVGLDDSTSFSNRGSVISIEAVNTPSNIFSLQYFQALMCATILEDTISEIRILRECNNELRIIKTLSDMELLRARKYNVFLPSKDDLDNINKNNLGTNQHKLNKLDKDRTLIYETIIVTYLGLSLERTYRSLVDTNTVMVDKRNHQVFLLEDEAKNRANFRELNKLLRQQRIHIKSVTYDTDMVIDDLKRHVEDASLNSEIRFRYISNWQAARSEQHCQSIKDRESRPSYIIEVFKQRMDHEQRVHQEVNMIMNIAINEKLQHVENWMNKYDKDMEAMDLKIQILKNDHTNKLEYRVELEKSFAKREKLMKDWIHFKDEREKARQYVEKMHNAALAVQAWWRGLLVRKQLGPYKPPKKPSTKDKKKKK